MSLNSEVKQVTIKSRLRKILKHKLSIHATELKEANKLLVSKYSDLENEKKEIISSINYAKLIHQALLPKKRHFERAHLDSFIFYKPKDIIGGDFYWLAQQDNFIFFAVADCTGHGVPGALLAVLTNSLLNYIVLGKGIYKTNEILQELDNRIIESFQLNELDVTFNNDWVDIGICMYDKSKGILEFSGAQRSLIIIGEEGFKEIRGNKFPVAGWQIETDRRFDIHEIEIKKSDMIYLFTDGYADQFGGNQNKKITKRRLNNILKTLYDKNTSHQEQELSNIFTDWKNKFEQTDDVCVMGVKF